MSLGTQVTSMVLLGLALATWLLLSGEESPGILAQERLLNCLPWPQVALQEDQDDQYTASHKPGTGLMALVLSDKLFGGNGMVLVYKCSSDL